MEKLDFYIDNEKVKVLVDNNQRFIRGKSEILSTEQSDICYGLPWYKNGYQVFNFLSNSELIKIRKSVKAVIKRTISDTLKLEIENFKLDNYHRYVKKNKSHNLIVSKTRDLFPKDFDFPVKNLIQKFGKLINYRLTSINPKTGKSIHIVLRVVRPHSNDYNPPHKDIYEAYDRGDGLSKFLNFWIPICGVTEKSSLPIVPQSHTYNEDKIIRTNKGANFNQYRVRLIKSWGGKNKLIRVPINYGQILVFSSHLVHGLALNNEQNKTRISLEFRLFKKNQD